MRSIIFCTCPLAFPSLEGSDYNPHHQDGGFLHFTPTIHAFALCALKKSMLKRPASTFFKPTNQPTGHFKTFKVRSVKLLKFEASRTNKKNLSELSERGKKNIEATQYMLLPNFFQQIYRRNFGLRPRVSDPIRQ